MKIKVDTKTALMALGIFITVVFTLNSLMRPDWVIGSDGLVYYAHLRSLMIDGDLQYENEFRDFNPYKHSVPDINLRTETGHRTGPVLTFPTKQSQPQHPATQRACSLVFVLVP